MTGPFCLDFEVFYCAATHCFVNRIGGQEPFAAGANSVGRVIRSGHHVTSKPNTSLQHRIAALSQILKCRAAFAAQIERVS